MENFRKVLKCFKKNTEKFKRIPHLNLVVKIWKNTQNTEKYSGNQENYYWENIQNSGVLKNTLKIQKNTNKSFKKCFLLNFG